MLTTDVRLLRNREVKTTHIDPISHPEAQQVHITDQKAKLFTYPKLDAKQRAKEGEVTIGDLHGNALKFIYFLIRQRILIMSKTDYRNIIKIYNKPADQLVKKDLNDFIKILNNARINKSVKIRLLGDELADRGNNDYFTLKIIEKMSQEISLEILCSNHGLDFINYIESGFKELFFSIFAPPTESLINLHLLIEKNLVTKSEIEKIVSQHYIPHLKLLSYDMNEENKCIVLFSHAPIGLRTVEALAAEFKVNYDEKNLPQTIDAINTAFTAICENKQVAETSKFKLAKKNGLDVMNLPLSYAFLRTVWGRNYDAKKDPLKKCVGEYSVIYTHGHEGKGYVPAKYKRHVINLDDEFGKYGDPVGVYGVFFSSKKKAEEAKPDVVTPTKKLSR